MDKTTLKIVIRIFKDEYKKFLLWGLSIFIVLSSLYWFLKDNHGVYVCDLKLKALDFQSFRRLENDIQRGFSFIKKKQAVLNNEVCDIKLCYGIYVDRRKDNVLNINTEKKFYPFISREKNGATRTGLIENEYYHLICQFKKKARPADRDSIVENVVNNIFHLFYYRIVLLDYFERVYSGLKLNLNEYDINKELRYIEKKVERIEKILYPLKKVSGDCDYSFPTEELLKARERRDVLMANKIELVKEKLLSRPILRFMDYLANSSFSDLGEIQDVFVRLFDENVQESVNENNARELVEFGAKVKNDMLRLKEECSSSFIKKSVYEVSSLWRMTRSIFMIFFASFFISFIIISLTKLAGFIGKLEESD